MGEESGSDADRAAVSVKNTPIPNVHGYHRNSK